MPLGGWERGKQSALFLSFFLVFLLLLFYFDRWGAQLSGGERAPFNPCPWLVVVVCFVFVFAIIIMLPNKN